MELNFWSEEKAITGGRRAKLLGRKPILSGLPRAEVNALLQRFWEGKALTLSKCHSNLAMHPHTVRMFLQQNFLDSGDVLGVVERDATLHVEPGLAKQRRSTHFEQDRSHSLASLEECMGLRHRPDVCIDVRKWLGKQVLGHKLHPMLQTLDREALLLPLLRQALDEEPATQVRSRCPICDGRWLWSAEAFRMGSAASRTAAAKYSPSCFCAPALTTPSKLDSPAWATMLMYVPVLSEAPSAINAQWPSLNRDANAALN